MAASVPTGAPATGPSGYPVANAATPAVSGLNMGPSLSGRETRQSQKLQNKDSWREGFRDFRSSVMKVVGSSNSVHVASITVVGHEEHQGTVYYRLRMRAANGGGEWEVLHRYSDFDKLRNDLGVKDRRVGSIFPQKTGFFSAGEQDIEKRKAILQPWLDGLVKEFSTGGDGRNALFAINRQPKLDKLHGFLGISPAGEVQVIGPIGSLFGPSAALVPSAPAPIPEATAPPMAETVEEEEAPQAVAVAVAVAVAAPVAEAAPAAETSQASEDAEMQAALAASLAQQAAEEDARIAADIAAVGSLEAADKQERLRLAMIAQAQLDLRQRADDEELARRLQMEEETEARQTEQLGTHRDQNDADGGIVQVPIENVLAAEEELRRLAQEEEARVQAEQESRSRAEQEEEEARRKAEEEEEAQRKSAEEEEARRKAAEEEEARRKAEEAEEAERKALDEETRRQAEWEQKSWLQKAMELANHARQLEDQGETQQAVDSYKKAVAMFGVANKKEKSDKVKAACAQKMDELTRRTDELTDIIHSAEAARVAELLSRSSVSSPAVADDASLEERLARLQGSPSVQVDAEAEEAARILASLGPSLPVPAPFSASVAAPAPLAPVPDA